MKPEPDFSFALWLSVMLLFTSLPRAPMRGSFVGKNSLVSPEWGYVLTKRRYGAGEKLKYHKKLGAAGQE